MLLWKKIINDLSHLNGWLIKEGLSTEYNVSPEVNNDLAIIGPAKRALTSAPPLETDNKYVIEFLKLITESDYSFVLKGGAILQCYYTIKANKLIKQKFTFYESPFIDDTDEPMDAEMAQYEIKSCPQ